MKVKMITVAVWTLCWFSSVSLAQGPKSLTAPTYYIAISAQHSYEDVIRVRGASNLPPGANVSLEVLVMNDQAWKDSSRRMCVAIDDKGLFDEEISLSAGNHYRNDLLVRATFLPNNCKQNAHVLQVLGNHGQYLGHDNRSVTMDEVENGMTRGMVENPQLFQVSGWYFGISTLARVEE